MQPTRGDFFIDCVRRIRRGRCVYPGGGGGEVNYAENYSSGGLRRRIEARFVNSK